ncbi:MAG: hypothetical protein QM723_08810 [Myxococcaceae bacterium]
MAFMKTVGLVLMAVLPGGLVFLMAFVLAKAVSEQMELESGSGAQRFGRAFSHLRLADLMAAAKRL